MAFTWYDAGVALLLGAAVLYEARQEFGRALLDAVATLFALLLAAFWADPAARLFQLSPAPYAAFTFLGLFAALLGTGLWASRLLHHTGMQLNADLLNPAFGVVFGLAIATMVGHAVTSGLYSYYGARAPEYLSHSQFATKLLNLGSVGLMLGMS